MDRMQWQRIEDLFELAHAQPVEARRRFLAEACGVDVSLRDEVEAMLAAASPDRALAMERFIVDRPTDAPDADALIGTCLGPWRLVSVLGRGGMGTVYRAERADGQYRQDVAVKLLGSGPRDSYAIERFRTERQVLASLTHPNIAALLDGGFAPDGTPYLVMELVDGVPITEWCATERLPLEARLRLFRVVCDAVQHAHRALVVHRDLKPSNILVSRSGSVKLLDFGIAKLLDPGRLGRRIAHHACRDASDHAGVRRAGTAAGRPHHDRDRRLCSRRRPLRAADGRSDPAAELSHAARRNVIARHGAKRSRAATRLRERRRARTRRIRAMRGRRRTSPTHASSFDVFAATSTASS